MMMNDDEHRKVEDNAEDLFKAATEGISDNVNMYEDKDDSGVSKKIVIGVVSVISIALIVLLVFTFLNKNDEFVDKTEDPSWVEKSPVVSNKGEWDFEYPADVPSWTKQVYNQSSFFEDEEQVLEMRKWVSSIQSLSFATSWIPSGETGEELGPEYTNDLSLEYDEEDELNNYFSYVLQENYIDAYGLGIQRLLNPVFGGWVYAQMHTDSIPQVDNAQFEVLREMFSDEWWGGNIKSNENYSNLPIMADWEGNKFYIESKENTTGVYYGEVVNTEENGVQVEDLGEGYRGHSILKVTTPVEFHAFTKDGKSTKTGKITLTLEPNSYEHDELVRVVVSNASLSLD